MTHSNPSAGYTSHGYWYGPGEPTSPGPVLVEVQAAHISDITLAASASWSDLPRWVVDAYEKGDLIFLSDGVLISTPEGQMRGDQGDWLIHGAKGELYPCRADIFAATYEPASSDPRHIVEFRADDLALTHPPTCTLASCEVLTAALDEVLRPDPEAKGDFVGHRHEIDIDGGRAYLGYRVDGPEASDG